MKLTPVSDHAGSNLRTFYREIEKGQNTNKLDSVTMSRLVEHLEDTVIGPDVYTFTSHTELVLNDQDTWQSVLVTINALERSGGPPGYEITYYVEAPWLCVTGYTESVEAAGKMIVEALTKAKASEIRLFR